MADYNSGLAITQVRQRIDKEEPVITIYIYIRDIDRYTQNYIIRLSIETIDCEYV